MTKSTPHDPSQLAYFRSGEEQSPHGSPRGRRGNLDTELNKRGLDFAPPQQSNQGLGIQSGILSCRSYLLEGHVPIDRYFKHSPPFRKQTYCRLCVSGRSDYRAPVEDAAVSRRLAWQTAKSVSIGLDLISAQLTSDQSKISPLVRLRNPKLIDRSRLLFSGLEKVLTESCPNWRLIAHASWTFITWQLSNSRSQL